MGHNTHIARKNTPNFTTSSSLVLIKPILDEIQPFKNSNFYYEIHYGRRQEPIAPDAGQIVRCVRLSIHFLVNFLKFFNGCISFNIGPNPTTLEDFVNLGVLFLSVGVLCPISHNTQTLPSPPRYESRQCAPSSKCNFHPRVHPLAPPLSLPNSALPTPASLNRLTPLLAGYSPKDGEFLI